MDSKGQRVFFPKTLQLCVWHTEVRRCYHFKLVSHFQLWFPIWGVLVNRLNKMYYYYYTIISKTLQELDVLFPVKTWRNLFMPLSPAGWIIVMVSFQRRALDSCSSSRTLLPGFWLEPENLSISHQSSGPYTGFQLYLGLILKYFYSFISHSMA